MQERPRWVFWLVLLGLLAAVIFSIAGGILLGSADLNVSTVIDVIKLKLFGIENEELKRSAISIVWELRLPRVLLALAAGGGLAVAGAAMQSVTQNVMADPYILGASSGASAAVAFAFVIGGRLPAQMRSFPFLPLADRCSLCYLYMESAWLGVLDQVAG